MKYQCSILAVFLIIFTCFKGVNAAASGSLTAEESGWLSKAHRSDRDGWVYVHIEGKPFERGFQRGYLTADEIEKFYRTLDHRGKFKTGRDAQFYVWAADSLFGGKIPAEYVLEMEGMVHGMKKAGKKITYKEMLMLAGFIDIYWYWYGEAKHSFDDDGPGGCSAFVATGDATVDGKFVLAHNTWTSFELCQYSNILLDIVPAEGHRIFMQTWGATLFSGTDFFLTGAGIAGCETTIGGFSGFDSRGIPVFIRARQAMQYADTIDEWAEIMLKGNSGAYANSWLLGDTKTNEIARLELGLKFHKLEKKKSGYFHGSNVAEDPVILRRETNADYEDVRELSVARRVRWQRLMKLYHGKIDIETGKLMLSDHYDSFYNREQPSSRTICGHIETDNGMVPGSPPPFSPSGAMDGKIVNAAMAKNMQFWARWGSSCGRKFDAEEFLEAHPQYEWMRGHLPDIPELPWVVFSAK